MAFYSYGICLNALAALNSFYPGLKEQSLGYAKTAAEIEPDNQRLQNNYKLILKAD